MGALGLLSESSHDPLLLNRVQGVGDALVVRRTVVPNTTAELARRIPLDLHRLRLPDWRNLRLLSLLYRCSLHLWLLLGLGKYSLAVDVRDVLGDVDIVGEDDRRSWLPRLPHLSGLEETRSNSSAGCYEIWSTNQKVLLTLWDEARVLKELVDPLRSWLEEDLSDLAVGVVLVTSLLRTPDDGSYIVWMFGAQDCPEELAVDASCISPLVRHKGGEAWDLERLWVDVPHRKLWPERNSDDRHIRLLLDSLLVTKYLLQEVHGDMRL